MCVDFRKINDLQPQVRRVDSATSGNISLVPLPKIDEMYAALRGAKIFTTLDLRSGYYHINLDEESKAKTAFMTPFGKYEFNSVPFGLAQAPAYFQQLISMVLQDCRDFAMAYLDDIIIFSRTPEEHLKHIEIIFQKLKAAGLKLKESKCDFFKSEIHYLGHLISDKGILTFTREAGHHTKYASSSDTQRNKTISWFNRLLSKIHSALLRNIQTASETDSKRHAV